MSSMDKRQRIGEAARAAGVHIQTMRYYERRGLLPRPHRSGGNYRVYGDSAVRRVRAIKRAQQLGFTLDEVGELDRIRGGEIGSDPLATLVPAKLREIDDKLRDLRRVKRALLGVIEACNCGGDVSRCDVLDGLGDPVAGRDGPR